MAVSAPDATSSANPVYSATPAHLLDVRGLACPLPLLKARKSLRDVEVGQVLEVLATDPGSWRDFAAFAEQSGNQLLKASERDSVYRYLIRRCV